MDLELKEFSLGREGEVCQQPGNLGRRLEELVLAWVLGEWTVRVEWELRVEGTGEAVQAEALELRRVCDLVAGTGWGGSGTERGVGSIL